MARNTQITKDIDKLVGANINKIRQTMGFSMTQLADKLEITHQQMYKYSTGENRISAGKLFLLSKILKTPLDVFFKDSPDIIMDGILRNQRMAIEVSRNFMDIKDAQEQIAINQLVRVLARKSNG